MVSMPIPTITVPALTFSSVPNPIPEEPPSFWLTYGPTWPRPMTEVFCGLYVNGVQVSTRTIGGNILTSTSPLRIGGNSICRRVFYRSDR